ncbi:ferredoxin-type protein NapF [Vibrio sinaloensis]|uniref:ferredoxin-type protein NapF n=1 Tax=Photobacterium sp. (strain ATCC 43367) TaxID=379097 RepID=UPI0020567D6E|nr:ferredoxin-type protein NapF [Vibrio sinaloensis]UPQ89872.1 ferredoxin-type protein NapF [Vibrio sinaloensis]
MVDIEKRRWFSFNKNQSNQLRLPWLDTAQSFTDICTRCGKCTDQCETKIIVNGDGGFPQVDFSLGECTFCYQCADVCPQPLFVSKQHSPWTALATIHDSCLAKKNVECRSCGDMCEPMAIQFNLQVGKVAQPILENEACTGCGACVAACPTDSISVSHSF